MKSFKESLITAVFTTKYIVEGKSTIVYVSHDEDGNWQFHGAENDINNVDVRLVALGEIIEIDPSFLDFSDLPEGFEAVRKERW